MFFTYLTLGSRGRKHNGIGRCRPKGMLNLFARILDDLVEYALENKRRKTPVTLDSMFSMYFGLHLLSLVESTHL